MTTLKLRQFRFCIFVYFGRDMNEAMRSFLLILTPPKVDWDTGHFFERGMEVLDDLKKLMKRWNYFGEFL